MRRALALAAALLAAGAASAAENDRYRLERSEGGYVRMDTTTGEMSLCEERDGQLVCKLAADERSAFQADVDRLQTSVDALEKRVGTLENSLAQRLENALPTEEQFEKSMSYMERFLRNFMGIVRDFDEDRPGGDPTAPRAQKT